MPRLFAPKLFVLLVHVLDVSLAVAAVASTAGAALLMAVVRYRFRERA